MANRIKRSEQSLICWLDIARAFCLFHPKGIDTKLQGFAVILFFHKFPLKFHEPGPKFGIL